VKNAELAIIPEHPTGNSILHSSSVLVQGIVHCTSDVIPVGEIPGGRNGTTTSTISQLRELGSMREPATAPRSCPVMVSVCKMAFSALKK
jgi:hypothetical protein